MTLPESIIFLEYKKYLLSLPKLWDREGQKGEKENKEVNHNFCLWRRGREWIVGENLFSLLPDNHSYKTLVQNDSLCEFPESILKSGVCPHIFLS